MTVPWCRLPWTVDLMWWHHVILVHWMLELRDLLKNTIQIDNGRTREGETGMRRRWVNEQKRKLMAMTCSPCPQTDASRLVLPSLCSAGTFSQFPCVPSHFASISPWSRRARHWILMTQLFLDLAWPENSHPRPHLSRHCKVSGWHADPDFQAVFGYQPRVLCVMVLDAQIWRALKFDSQLSRSILNLEWTQRTLVGVVSGEN